MKKTELEVQMHKSAALQKEGIQFQCKNVWKNVKRCKYLYILLVIPLLYYFIFHYCAMYGITIAFKDYNIVQGIMRSPWVGFKHFSKFFPDPYFWKLVRNTFLLGIYSIIWGFPMPILLAIFLNEVKSNTYKRFVQSVSYLPHFISTVVVCGMVVNFVSVDGLVNQVITFFGGEAKPFLMHAEYFRTIYIASGIWKGVGWGSIIYLAALTGINSELYEAASIDGAGRFRKTLHVTLPGITPTITIMLILELGRVLSIGYEKVLLLYNGNIYETADIISTYVYRRGILGNDFSYATAVNLFQSVVSLIFIYVANKISNKVSETGLW